MSRPDVYIIADNIYSPLGKTSEANFARLKNGVSAVGRHHRPDISDIPIAASLFEPDTFQHSGYTRFEQLSIASIADALSRSDIDPKAKNTGFILSSTKGNISLLETNNDLAPKLQNRVALTTSAKLIAKHFGIVTQPVIISNACISGVMAMVAGMRMIQSGQHETIIVCGADVISKFIVSGFQSFQALSAEVCRPFDKNRNGLNLGEGSGTVILSVNPKYKGHIRITGGGISNDANHISGPSRTGQELADAINMALKTAGLKASDIGMISAHGTATPYNDEMEANALTIAGLTQVPVNGIKAHYGHTLGAAGLIEGIIALHCMKEGILLPTLGFTDTGTRPLNIITESAHQQIDHCLKTASGFGGCNGAMVLSK